MADQTDQNQPLQQTQQTQEPQLYEVTVKGETLKVSLEELKKGYEKGMGAEKTFQEAAALRKAADAYNEIQALKQKLSTGTAGEDEIRRWGEIWDMSPEEINAMLYPDNNEVTNQSNDDKGQENAPRKITEADLDPALRAKILSSADTSHTTRKNQFRTDVSKILDKNETYVTMIKDMTPEAKELFRERLLKQAEDEAVSRMNDGRPYSPELVQRSAEAVVEDAQTFSKLVAPQPAETPAAVPNTLLGFGGGGGLTGITSQTEQPVERVAINDPDYGAVFQKRFLGKLWGGKK